MRASPELPLDFTLPAPRLHRYFVVDVFSARALEGNQLAVFTDGSALPDGELQRLARELNLAETVFVFPPEEHGDVRIRIFTPERELPFAGHPVLGAAFVVGEALAGDSVRLETGIGTVPIELERKLGRVSFARFAQPPPPWEPYEQASELLAALGVAGSLLPVEAYRNGPLHAYVALESEEAVAALRPDLETIAVLGVGANTFAGSGRRWKTRMFAPAYGIPEDAATGSAAGPLALHLARHGWIPFGEEIEIHQGQEIRRPSLLYSRALGDAEQVERLEVGGSAVIVARGEFGLDSTVG